MRSITFLVAAAFLIVSSAFARLDEISTSNANSIQYLKSYKYSEDKVKWDSFIETNGNWTIIVDETTGNPHRAFGKPIPIEGCLFINEKNIEQVSTSFIDDNRDIFNIGDADLEFVSSRKVKDNWYVTYRQKYNGLDVIGSEIELRINKNNAVFAFGVKVFKDLKAPVAPQISYQAAVANATDNMIKTDKGSISLLSNENAPEKHVLPIRIGNGYIYKLAYEVKFRAGYAEYLSYVDAMDGNVLFRQNRTPNVETEIQFSGFIQEHTPGSEITEGFFSNQTVYIGGEEYITDSEGKIIADIQDTVNARFKVKGKYCNIVSESTPEVTVKIAPGENYYHVWNDDNSTVYERFAFYHLNKIHDWIKNVDPDLTCMENDIVVKFENSSNPMFGNQPNAYSSNSGDTIGFINYKNDTVMISKSPSVLYHEYGHSINTKLYIQLGSEEGMINLAGHEALADITSSLVLDDPRVGKDIWKNDPEKTIRNCDNENKYPYDMQGESHHDGQILAGALWDLREMTSIEYVAHLTHFARYGMPDDEDTGITFSEWFLELLIVDDDDGDLTNGTPNMDKILTSFNMHNIGSNLLYTLNFSHEPVIDYTDRTNPIEVQFTIDPIALPNSEPEEVQLVYSIDDFETESVVDAQYNGDGQYTAVIPVMESAAYVKYYFQMKDPIADQIVFLPEFGIERYNFLWGYYSNYLDNFEEGGAWTIGSPDDDADYGIFEIAEPQELKVGYPVPNVIVQPGEDVSVEGNKCVVTDPQSGDMMSMLQHMLSPGQTTITSNIIDISGVEKPIIKFYAWFTAMALMMDPGSSLEDSNFILSITTNGTDWEPIYHHNETTLEWKKIIVPIPEWAEGSETLQVKIVATNEGTIYSGIEVLIDDFEIMSPVEALMGVEEPVITEEQISCYPNPAENYSNISINIDNPSFINVSVVDIMGKEVASLANGQYGPGTNNFKWDASNVTPGIYNVVITIDNTPIVKRIIIL